MMLQLELRSMLNESMSLQLHEIAGRFCMPNTE